MSIDQTRYDGGMLSLLRDLFAHQAWADTAMLEATRGHRNALEDENLRKTLHHVLIVQRFFLAMVARVLLTTIRRHRFRQHWTISNVCSGRLTKALSACWIG